MISDSSHDVALISCVKSKQEEAAQPRNLYTSAYFEKMRAYAEQEYEKWWILSAKHALLHPDANPIEPYEKTLNEASKAERRQWAQDVIDELREQELLTDEVRLDIHAGKAYYGELLPLLQESDIHEVQIPLEGLQIGRRLA